VTHGKFAAANSVVLHQLSNVCIRGSGEERIHHRHVNTAMCSRMTDEIERHSECVMCALRILFWAMLNEENIDVVRVVRYSTDPRPKYAVGERSQSSSFTWCFIFPMFDSRGYFVVRVLVWKPSCTICLYGVTVRETMTSRYLR
jgi:hypothetical protein